MFLDNISEFLLMKCDSHNLSYEHIAEPCNISSRQVGNIIRKKFAPRITTLENMCIAFDVTPNDILLFKERD